MSSTLIINPIFNLKQIVYLKTDVDQLPRIVLYIIVGDKEILYGLRQGSNYEIYSDFEITSEKNLTI